MTNENLVWVAKAEDVITDKLHAEVVASTLEKAKSAICREYSEKHTTVHPWEVAWTSIGSEKERGSYNYKNLGFTIERKVIENEK